MYKVLLFILSCISFCPLYAQTGKIIQNKATLFQLNDDKDTIEFIVVDTKLDQQKPIFLWCQGSLPQPLFGEIEKGNIFFQGGGVANFNYKEVVKNYHLVIISMPKTPVIAYKENLNDQFLYVPDLNNPDALDNEYIEGDFLDNYVRRADVVLNFLKNCSWVNNDELIVAGHSQGTKVATKIAIKNNAVSHLVMFNPNPIGRIDEFIRKARLDAQLKKITWEKADSLMNYYYDFFKEANNPNTVKEQPKLNAWRSFSEPTFDDWIKLNIPIYIAYGTEDLSSAFCDVIPLFFTSEGKDNLTIKRYLNLQHNFFKVESDGTTNYRNPNWNKVITEFLEWKKN